MKKVGTTAAAILLTIVFLGCSEPMTTREKGAVYGTVGGAGLGAIIGSATGNAGAGAGIGAAVGLVGGALIGDQTQARQQQDADVQRAAGRPAGGDRPAAKGTEPTQSTASALARQAVVEQRDQRWLTRGREFHPWRAINCVQCFINAVRR